MLVNAGRKKRQPPSVEVAVVAGLVLGSDGATGSVDGLGTSPDDVLAVVDVPSTTGELVEVETGTADSGELEPGVDDEDSASDEAVVVA